MTLHQEEYIPTLDRENTNGQTNNPFYAHTREDTSLMMLLDLLDFSSGQEHIIRSFTETPCLTISMCLFIELL